MRVFCIGLLFFIAGLHANPSQFLSKSENVRAVELSLTKKKDEIYSEPWKFAELRRLLTDYSCPSSFKNSIRKFVKEELRLDLSKIKIVEMNRRNSGSPNRTLLYFIYDSNKKLIAVIKCHPNLRLFSKELNTLTTISSLNLRYSKWAIPLGIGKIYKDQIPIFLIAQSAAEGKSLHAMAKELKKSTGEERKEKLTQFKKSVRRLAEALTELHGISMKKKMPHPSSLKNMVPECNSWRKEILDENGIVLHPQRIKTFFRDLDSCITTVYPKVFYTHGDLNLSNIFYNEKTGEITFIDTLGFTKWENGMEDSQAFYRVARDYSAIFIKIHDSLRVFPTKEKTILEKIYTSIYCRKAAKADNERILQIYWEVMAICGCIHHDLVILKKHEISNQPLDLLKKHLERLFRLREEFYTL